MVRDVDQKVIAPARGNQTDTADFDRNRDGLYGGLPKARDPDAAGAEPKTPHPPSDRKSGHQKSAPTRG